MNSPLEYESQNSLFVQTLTPSTPSPIILSVPHDGLRKEDFEGIYAPRKIGHHIRDVSTWLVAKDILLHHPCSAVRGLMPRKFIDYNRSWPEAINYYPLTQSEVHTAIDDPRLEKYYRNYHAQIDERVADGSRFFEKDKILLLDIHGFSKQPPYAPPGGFDLIFGTGNRQTILHNNADIALYDEMRARGYNIFLPKAVSVGPLEDHYSTDYTTRHHSQHHQINAIQIEIAIRFRTKDSAEAGRKLSTDIADSLKNIYN